MDFTYEVKISKTFFTESSVFMGMIRPTSTLGMLGQDEL